MYKSEDRNIQTPIVRIVLPSPEDVLREQTLRVEFARFLANAPGDMRTIYDAFIANTKCAKNVEFEEVADGVRGWWCRPLSPRSDRAILYLHGGAYGLGSAKAFRGIASQIASRTGISVFAADYPLAPEATVPAAPDAALKTYRWLVSQGFTSIAVVGDSAGGGLSLVTLQQIASSADDRPAVAGVVFSPWTDLAFTGRSMHDPDLIDPLLTYEALQESARAYLGGVDPRDPKASPLYGSLEGSPPLYIQVGSDERLLDDSVRYANAAAAAGCAVRLEIWQGMHHVFELDVAHLACSRDALDRAAEFLTQAFERGPA